MLPCQTYFAKLGDTGNDTGSVKYLHMFALYIQTVQMFSSTSLGITYFHT